MLPRLNQAQVEGMADILSGAGQVFLVSTGYKTVRMELDEKGNYYGVLSWWDLQQKLVEELKNQLELLQEYAFGPHRNVLLDQIVRK